MKIEILFPEFCNLFGDSANAMFLKKNLKNAKFYNTSINDVPKFINENIDLIYLGSSSENHQEAIIKALSKYKKELVNYIENNKIIIATGNSFEIFGKYILQDDKKIKGLEIFDYYSKRDLNHRHNSLFLGLFEGIKIIGNKSSFSFTYASKNYSFISKIKGYGLNKEDNNEGIRYKNFYGTYLLGPFLIINPYFTKYIFKLLGYNKNLVFEKEIIDAYNYKLKEFEDDKTIFESLH